MSATIASKISKTTSKSRPEAPPLAARPRKDESERRNGAATTRKNVDVGDDYGDESGTEDRKEGAEDSDSYQVEPRSGGRNKASRANDGRSSRSAHGRDQPNAKGYKDDADSGEESNRARSPSPDARSLDSRSKDPKEAPRRGARSSNDSKNVHASEDSEDARSPDDSRDAARKVHHSPDDSGDASRKDVPSSNGHKNAPRRGVPPSDAPKEPSRGDHQSSDSPKKATQSKKSNVPKAQDVRWEYKACRTTPDDVYTHPSAPGACLARQQKLWNSPGQDRIVIKYFFIDGGENQHNKVKLTIREWQDYASVLFEEVVNVEDAQIRITFNPDDGSWSYVGTDALEYTDGPTMNLGWVYDTDGAPAGEEKGSILHEFGHGLGLMHEHQSPNRSKIFLDTEATITFYTKDPQWTPEMVQDQILKVYNGADLSIYSKFDKDSIMEYPVPAELSSDGKAIPYNTELSALDKAYISLVYPFLNSKDAAGAKITLQQAMDAASLSASAQDDIRKHVKAGDLTNVRNDVISAGLSSTERGFVLSALNKPSSGSAVHSDFLAVLQALMEYLPMDDAAEADYEPISTKVFEDPIRGPFVGKLLSDAVVALHTRASFPESKSRGFRDIFSDPLALKVIRQLLEAAVSYLGGASTDSPSSDVSKLPDHAAQHAFLGNLLKTGKDILQHPVFGQIAKTLISQAVNAVTQVVDGVASNPQHALLPPDAHDGASHDFFGDLLGGVTGAVSSVVNTASTVVNTAGSVVSNVGSVLAPVASVAGPLVKFALTTLPLV